MWQFWFHLRLSTGSEPTQSGHYSPWTKASPGFPDGLPHKPLRPRMLGDLQTRDYNPLPQGLGPMRGRTRLQRARSEPGWVGLASCAKVVCQTGDKSALEGDFSHTAIDFPSAPGYNPERSL